VPRWMASSGLEMSEKISLHVFCDASKDAYATCIYLRSHVEEEVKIQLVMSKARVAPKKRLTIPRLELLACLIGARLAQQVIRELGMSEEKVWYWTDSSTALTWIQSDKPWRTFVSNRGKELRHLTTADKWYHVAGEKNPADLPSRGCSVQKLKEARWCEGLDWLRQEEKYWYHASPTVDASERS
ncbi:hypothetical protein ILUMI_26574, partial [Ignelater luminosus]